MKIVDKNTVIQNIGDTKTVQNFGRLLGTKPHKLGQVVTMYPNLAISTLTDALKNVYYNPKKDSGSFTPINSMCIEWDIDVNFIKKVKIVGAISGSGVNKNVESIILEERYYDKHDTFTLENKQQLFVVAVPKKLSAKRWEYKVTLVGNDLGKSISGTFAAAGKSTRYRSNYHPELSERGYTKFVSNTETHRNYMSRQRASVDFSGDYAMHEDIYIKAGKNDYASGSYFKMNKKEKECMDTFLLSREQNCIFSETNYDVNGKCLDQDDHGRDIPMGDGVIPQIERYCDKFSFSILTSEVLDDVMSAMREKSDKPTGNTYAVVCNERLYDLFGKLMLADLRFQSPSDGAYFYSKAAANGKVKVGAEFDSYKFQGNVITFMPDRALSQEYADHAYGIFLDTGADLASGRPNVAMFTMKGSEIISGNLVGMGGKSGNASGEVSTSVHGSSYHLLGYSAAVVFNPYKSFILEEAKTY
jgi:hypothetical protein